MLGFSVYSILDVKFDFMLVLRRQFFEFLRETLYKTCLRAPGSGWSRKKGSSFFLPTTVENAYQNLTSLKVCDLVGTHFRRQRQSLALNKKMAISPFSTVHGGQHDIKYLAFELPMHAAFVAVEIWGFMPEPARA